MMFSLWLILFVIKSINSLSVCDEVDVTFVIDKESLVENFDDISFLIESIIEHGSSEMASFSTYVYGNGIAYNKQMRLFEETMLTTTYNTHRADKLSIVMKYLTDIYNNITSNSFENIQLKSISLQDAFFRAVKQEQPIRIMSEKRSKFQAEEYSQHALGLQDDANKFFIFDHNNKLIDGSNHDICSLLNYMSDKEDESIHFIMGQEFKHMEDKLNEICNKKYTKLFNEDSFFYLNKTDYDNADENIDYLIHFERVYHLTCPALSSHPEYDGHIHLTHNNQYLEAATVVQCSLQFKGKKHKHDHEFSVTSIEPEKSYIIIDDYLEDYNTWHVGDNLITDPQTFDEIYGLGCISPIYKILGISIIKKINDEHSRLKLKVGVPESPMDYILYSDIHFENLQSTRRRMPCEEKEKKISKAASLVRFFSRKYGTFKELSSHSSDPIEGIEEEGCKGSGFTVKGKWENEWGPKIWGPKIIGGNKKIEAGPVLMSGTFEGKLSYKVKIVTTISTNAKFVWTNVWKWEKVDIDATVKFLLDADATIKAEIKAEASMDFPLFPEIQVDIIVPLGPVPLIITPYFGTKGHVEIMPMIITFEMACKYKLEVDITYKYKAENKKEITTTPEKRWAISKVDHSKTNTCTPKLTITNEDKKPCDVDFGFRWFKLTPQVGIKLYKSIGMDVGVTFTMPLKLNVKLNKASVIGAAVCGNKRADQCGGTKGKAILKATPVVKVTAGLNLAFYVKYPNFFNVIKIAWKVQKLYKKIAKDIADINRMVSSLEMAIKAAKTPMEAKELNNRVIDLNALKHIIENAQTELTASDMQPGKGKEDEGYTDIIKTFATDIGSFAWPNSKASTTAKAWVTKISKRVKLVTAIIKEVKSCMTKRKAIVKAVKDFPYDFPKPLWEYKVTNVEQCFDVPPKLGKAFKDACCADAAHRGGFGDWYDGYELYDGHTYDNHRKQKQIEKYQLNSAPVFGPKPTFNPFLSLMLLDTLVIMTIVIIMAGIIGALCGAFVFYSYNKLVKGKRYNQLSVEDNVAV